MSEVCYVPFEPGIGSDPVLHSKHAIAQVVQRVPEVASIKTPAADSWFERPQLRNLNYTRTRQPGEPATRVVIQRDDKHLFIAFECYEPQMNNTRRFVPRDATNGAKLVLEGAMARVVDYDDNVAVLLDASHDHSGYYRLRVNMNGARRDSIKTSKLNWTAIPEETEKPNDVLKWESEVALREDRWRAAFKIDLTSAGIDVASQPVVGLGLSRTRIVECMRTFSWSPTYDLEQTPALTLGDLYLRDNGIALESIDVNGGLKFESNTIQLALSASKDREVRAVLVYTNKAGEFEIASESQRVKVRPGAETKIPISVEIHGRLRKGLLKLSIMDATTQEPLFRSAIPVDGNYNLRLHAPHRGSKKELPVPDRNDPNFHWKMRDRVIAMLPRFVRKTTAQGARSDFTLAADDGSVEFNLMQSGALKRIADWICSIFKEDDERIIAVAQMTNDSWVTTHADPRVSMQYELTPLSMLRLGGGHCYSRAVVGAGIMNEMPNPQTGKNHVAWACLVLGHVVTAVQRGDDYILFDPSAGHFFYTADNTRFATSRELGQNHELIKRVSQSFNGIKNYGYPEGHVRLDEGVIVWPAGAPPR